MEQILFILYLTYIIPREKQIQTLVLFLTFTLAFLIQTLNWVIRNQIKTEQCNKITLSSSEAIKNKIKQKFFLLICSSYNGTDKDFSTIPVDRDHQIWALSVSMGICFIRFVALRINQLEKQGFRLMNEKRKTERSRGHWLIISSDFKEFLTNEL